YYYYIQFPSFKPYSAFKGVDQDLKWFIPVILKMVHARKNPKFLRESLFAIQKSMNCFDDEY
ncbi:MAG: hypothetical protein M5E90_05060, partial [Asgard group archaeon]|nr:hypothetical protein [Asgard group archaeon]